MQFEGPFKGLIVQHGIAKFGMFYLFLVSAYRFSLISLAGVLRNKNFETLRSPFGMVSSMWPSKFVIFNL